MDKNTSAVTASRLLEKDQAFQLITIVKETGLGLKIVGGINRNEGPLVYVQEIVPGGDCCKDGRLKPGDQLISINQESLIGVSFEEAKSILTRAELRSESAWEIAFIRQKSDGGYPESPSRVPTLQSSGEGEAQTSTFSLLSSPSEVLTPKASSIPKTKEAILPLKTSQIKTGYKKTEQIPITSSDNSSTKMSNTDIAPAWEDNYGPQEKKIYLNPSVRLKAEKLEMALHYLGIEPTEQQQQALRQQVQADSRGTVSFGDFVQVARNVFRLQLEDVNIDAHEISNVLGSQLLPCDSLEADDMGRLQRERNTAVEEVGILKEKLFKSERQRKQLAEELQSVKQEAKAVVEETRALRSRIHLAEAAQRQARGMEMDYEEVIRLLEAEIAELKARLADYSDQNKETVQDLRKRITVLDCQLRKSEMACKTFEASTEKLLHFVEVKISVPIMLERRAMLASQTSLTHLGRSGRNIPAALVLESKELVRSVRAILDMDCLPYGWEEAYTADGIKYFINHVTQTTSWIHPVTSALNLSCSEENEEDCSRELPSQKS
ncbi:syntaxin-binding protein 4 [Echinops telfairi]|uniref:Syntaxin-binding protein 4 n=1 Tax=Echinops telfairi TaxID=9371 RepID=A0ABM0ITQ2_ECHTE|nr:syntaxin-binding protein 4 [Echinops telfairi]